MSYPQYQIPQRTSQPISTPQFVLTPGYGQAQSYSSGINQSSSSRQSFTWQMTESEIKQELFFKDSMIYNGEKFSNEQSEAPHKQPEQEDKRIVVLKDSFGVEFNVCMHKIGEKQTYVNQGQPTHSDMKKKLPVSNPVLVRDSFNPVLAPPQPQPKHKMKIVEENVNYSPYSKVIAQSKKYTAEEIEKLLSS